MDQIYFHRGMNIEVSMPTGSLCSERNAIGTAVASNPCIHRKDMKGIAVLSLTIADSAMAQNPLSPCGSCMEWLRKIAEVNPDFHVVTFDSEACTKVYVNKVD